jgi:hypothetical protein
VAFAVSLCALLWVAFSVAHHILRHGSSPQEPESLVHKRDIEDATDRL